MSFFKKLFNRFSRKSADGRQKQHIPPAAPSNSTSEGTPATRSRHAQQEQSGGGSPSASPMPPEALSNITSEDLSVTSREHVQQEQLRGGSSASPMSPAAPSNITSPSVTGSEHDQQEQSRDILPSVTPADQQQPPATQSLWDRAYDALAKENPGLVKDYEELLAKEEQMANSVLAPHGLGTRSDRSPRQAQLSTVIQYGLQRMEDNKTTFKIGGREIILADQITKASKFLLWSKDWIGSAVKASPEASIVWSGVCLILPLLTNPTTAAEANRNGFVYVTSRLRYYVALEPLLRRLDQNSSVNEAVIRAVNDHIVDLYHAILDFQLSSVRRFYQSRLKTHIHDTVPSKDWEQTRLDIEMREGTVNDDLGQINGLVSRQELENLNRTSENIRATMVATLSVATQQLSISEHELTITEQQLIAMEGALRMRAHEKQLAAEDDAQTKQEKCLQLFYLTPNSNGATYDWYKDRVEDRIEGTCKWFLQHKNFRGWLSQESGPLLVSADPGCGKSVLAKYLIDHELARQSATICYFFFKDHDQDTICQALSALLHQLFSRKTALIQHAMELHSRMGEALVNSETSLWTILRDALRDPQAGPVIFVIDALDECDESQLSGLIQNLENMFRDQQLVNARFKVLMTSRPYEQVVREFRSLLGIFQYIRIPGEKEFETISQEINKVIHHRVEKLAEKHELPDKIKSSLNNKLLSTVHRTYLWVYLVFDYLDKGLNDEFKKTEDGIDAAIRTLPTTVNQAYDQMLNRSQNENIVKAVRKALSIILVAYRPLTVSEMNIAMSLDGQGRGRSIYDLDLEKDKDFETRFRTLCGLFVNVHHGKIYFLHQTAREFLIQSSTSTPTPTPTTVSPKLQWHHSITTRDAHSVLADICIFYLDRMNSTDTENFRLNSPDTETFRQGRDHGALSQYSVEYWSDHCREAEFEQGSVMVDIASGLCNPDLTSHSLWASIISGRYRIPPESSTNVLIASHLGLTPVTELLLSRGAEIEVKDRQDKTALVYAVECGHEAVAQLLLKNRAGVEARDDDGWTPLMFAARSGLEAIARLLLKYRADVKASEQDGRTPLMFATESGHETVTRLLLESGADVDARDDNGWTALMFAAESGHEAATQLLLENGAAIEARDNNGSTALMYASESGHEVVARLLIKNGAGVEERDDGGWTALTYAARSGHEAVTRLLLENGAAVGRSDDNGRTALIYAAGSGHEAVTMLLLKNGADVGARDEDDMTALLFAAESGHDDVTQRLLENGANIKARDKDGRTALLYAIKYRHEAVARSLVKNGADVEVKDDDGRRALIYAARSGHEAVTLLLLKNGADTEATDSDGMTALIYAAESGHEDVTWLLLENDANIEARDNDDRTALSYAARFGHLPVTWLLLENGANIEARDADGRTALIYAARSGHEAVTLLLLKNGANVEARDEDGMTALLFAAESGHQDVTQRLLEYGADVEERDDDGWTALRYAAKFGHKLVAWLLLYNGADVEAKDKKGWTALSHASEGVTQLLLANGAQVEAEDVEGSTA